MENTSDIQVIDNNIIYALLDPDTGSCRYVGKSVNGVRRAKEHAQTGRLAKERNRCRNWIVSLVNAGKMYNISIIDTATDNEELFEKEIYWIGLMRLAGADLTNLTIGGDGPVGYRHTEDAKRRIGRAAVGNRYSAGATWWRGRKHSEETRRRLSESHKGHKPSAEAVRKAVLARRGRKMTEANKLKLLACARARKGLPGKPWNRETRKSLEGSMKGKKQSAEARTKMSKAHKGVPLSPERRAAMKEAQRVRREREAATTGPVKRSAESRAKMSAAAKRRRAREAAAKTTPIE